MSNTKIQNNQSKNQGHIICGAKDYPYYQTYLPKGTSGCPIRNLKIIRRNRIKPQQIQATLNPLPEGSGPFPQKVASQYIALDEDYVIGVSYNDRFDPLVSVAFLEKRPCLNNAHQNVASNLKKR